jgi:hypothetical protein
LASYPIALFQKRILMNISTLRPLSYVHTKKMFPTTTISFLKKLPSMPKKTCTDGNKCHKC